MVKRFSTVRYNQRGSQSYMKNRRGRKEIEVSRKRERGTQEERETDLCSYLFPECSLCIAQTPTEVHRTGLGRVGGGRK